MRELPTGTVTFLFTDIVGSTPLWEQMPEAMRPAVALHHALLREAIDQNGGVVVKIIGDAFQAAFSLADQALAAALMAQRGLQSAEWPDQTGPLTVRMGLHTGPAELERSADGVDYAVSHTLNRVARIMSIGSGGQVLLSREAADMVERSLPSAVTLKDMGEHLLKGMVIREHLFQVCVPDLLNEFPPLSSGVLPPNNLPAQLTSFIGRHTQLEALQRLLTAAPQTARLITLTGPGGTGKTRLALQAASSLLNTFPDGVWLVELAPLADHALVPLTVAATLGLHEVPGKPITQRLIEHLTARRMLLIFDNCEHVVESAAELAGQLLANLPPPANSGDQPRDPRHDGRNALPRALAVPAASQPPPRRAHRAGPVRVDSPVCRARAHRPTRLHAHRGQRPARHPHLPAPGRHPAGD